MSRYFNDHIDALAHFPMPPCDCCGRGDCVCPVLEEEPTMSEPRQACPFPYALTPAAAKVLRRAYRRESPHGVCPTPGLWAASQAAVLRSLREDGYITDDGSPVLTDKGKLVAKDLCDLSEPVLDEGDRP